MAPLLSKISVLAAKIEKAVGTAETVTAADATWLAYDVKLSPKITLTERQKQGGFGRLASVPEGHAAECTFAIDLTAGSATPSWAAVFLASCGLGPLSGAYQLDNRPPEAAGSTTETITIAQYENGKRRAMYGCMGNAVFKFVAGKLVRVEFTYQGVWQGETDAAILEPTYLTDSPLRFVSSALELTSGSPSWNPLVESLSLDLGNKIYLRPDSSTAKGFHSAVISDRLPKVTINPEAVLVATQDVIDHWLDYDVFAASWAASEGGDSATFETSNLQIINPQRGDREGVMTEEIEAQINDDDLEITFA